MLPMTAPERAAPLAPRARATRSRCCRSSRRARRTELRHTRARTRISYNVAGTDVDQRHPRVSPAAGQCASPNNVDGSMS